MEVENPKNIKKINSIDELSTVQDGEFFEWDGNYTAEDGTPMNYLEQIEIAEKEIEKRKDSRVNFRWDPVEIRRCKKIAKAKGMPYQIYIKSTLKLNMDKDEKELGLA